MILHLTSLDTRNYRFEAPGLTPQPAPSPVSERDPMSDDLDSTPDGTLIPQTIVRLTASMPYGAQAGRVPRTLEELETWLTGLRSVLAGVARDQDSDRRDLRILLEQRDAVRAFLGTGEHA